MVVDKSIRDSAPRAGIDIVAVSQRQWPAHTRLRTLTYETCLHDDYFLRFPS